MRVRANFGKNQARAFGKKWPLTAKNDSKPTRKESEVFLKSAVDVQNCSTIIVRRHAIHLSTNYPSQLRPPLPRRGLDEVTLRNQQKKSNPS